MRLARPLVAALAALATAGAASGQEVSLPFQVPDRKHAKDLVHQYEEAAAQKDWRKAVDRLQQILDLPPDDHAVVRVAGVTPALFESTGLVARRLFDGLPPEGRAAWEANSRSRAEDLVARGLRLRREQDLRDAARRYPAVDVRRRAHDALAQLALVRSDLSSAQFQLELLADEVEAADRPQALARLALVCAQSGDADAFAKVRAQAAAHAAAVVPSGRGGEKLGDLLARLAKVAGSAPSGSSRQFGGDATGSGLSEAPPASESTAHWRAPTEFAPGRENTDSVWTTMGDADMALVRPVFPLVAHGRVFTDSGLSLVATELASGQEAWRYDSPQSKLGPDWRDSFTAAHAPAIADGVVYAALATRSDSGDPGFDRKFQQKTIVFGLPHRVLYAFDARTGEVLWSHETSRIVGREDAAELNRESVSSPPLVVGDDVIVSTWTYEGIYDARLVCFDRRTGRTRWRTSVAEGQQELNLFGRPVKELTTSALATAGGRVFFATGLGVAAAVERDDGRVAWLSAYPQGRLQRAQRWFDTKDREITWWPSPVAASDLAVIAAPPDAAQLIAFDPETGRQIWRHDPRDAPNHNYRWFLGASGGRAYVLGSRLWAYDVATGDPVWSSPDAGRLAAPKAPFQPPGAVGMGVLTRDRVYVPTQRSILVLSAATGAFDQLLPLPQDRSRHGIVTGNLVSGDGALLVVDRDQMHAVFRAEDRLQRIEARLAENPDDPQLALEAGETYAAADQLDRAIEVLTAAGRRLPDLAPRVRDRSENLLRRVLYEAYVRRADSRRLARNLEGAIADLRAAIDTARDRGDAVRGLFRLAELCIEAGRVADGEAALRRVDAEFADVLTPAGDDKAERAQAGALALFRLGELALRSGKTALAVSRWIDLLEQHGSETLGTSDVATQVKDRLASLDDADGVSAQSAVHARAQKAFDAATAAHDAARLDRVARLYPDPGVAGQAALAAAELHLAAGRAGEAVGVLKSYLQGPHGSALGARALWKLAAAYRSLGEIARERGVLQRLVKEAPGERLDDGRAASEAVRAELTAPRFLNVSSALPDPRPPLALRWQTDRDDQAPALVLPLSGTTPAELAGRMVTWRAGELAVVDAESGAAVWSKAVGADYRAVIGAPGTIALAGNERTGDRTIGNALVVVGFAAADGRQLWRQRLPGLWRDVKENLGMLYVLYQDASAGSGRPAFHLTAISLANGEIVATRPLDANLRSEVRTAEDAVVVVENVKERGPSRRALLVLDGTTLALRGRVEVASPASPFLVHPPLSSIVVTTDGSGSMTALDVSRAEAAWKPSISLPQGRAVKAMFGVPDGVIVSDDANGIRRLDAATGREIWAVPLTSYGELVFGGEAAEGDLVVATLRSRDGESATAVALDAVTGRERWRTPLPRADDMHPQICASVVSFELLEHLSRGARSRVVLLDRASGEKLQEIEHPTIGKTYQIVAYGADWVCVSNGSQLAVYGRAPGGK